VSGKHGGNPAPESSLHNKGAEKQCEKPAITIMAWETTTNDERIRNQVFT
jgi:hypothetical protein